MNENTKPEPEKMAASGSRAAVVRARGLKAYRAKCRWGGDGVYWAESARKARMESWRHFSDVFGTREPGFMDYMCDVRVRRAPEFDDAYRGRQGLLPEFAAAP